MKKTAKGAIALAWALFCVFPIAACGSPKAPSGETEQDGEVRGGVASAGAYTLDAVLSDWTEADRENGLFIPVADGQSAHIYGKQTEEGVVLAVEARHHRYVTTSEEKFSNSHILFAFSDGEEPRYVTATGDHGGVSGYAVRSVSDGTMRTTVFELFVEKADIPSFGALRFGFRLRLSGYEEDYFWGYGGNWRADECDIGHCTYFLSANGITGPSGAEGGADGLLGAEWENTEEIASAYHEYGALTMRGRMDGEGVYLFFTATHKEWHTHQYWCYNPNFEFRLGASSRDFATFRIVKYSPDITLFSSTADASMHMERGADGLYHTVCEVFVPYENIPGGGQDAEIFVGASFRADEDDVEPWVPYFDRGSATWDMRCLALTQGGWKRI